MDRNLWGWVPKDPPGLNRVKGMIIYIAMAMSVIEGILIMSKSGCEDKDLLDYIYEN